MKKIINDPLLTAARFGIVIMQILLVIGMIAVGIAMAVTAIGAMGYVPDNVEFTEVAALPHTTMWLAALTMLLMLVATGLIYDFVIRLRQIIDTVGQGDPFVVDNAVRLTRMGWLALAVQLTMLVAAALAGWVEAHASEDVFELNIDVSLFGFVLAVILFILARVFRKGAEMRAELEGTV
jgi:Protein of unknown function (DUF2975)